MSVLLDAIRGIHNSFRGNTSMINKLTNLPVHKHSNLAPILERHRIYNEALIWNDMEEEYLYTQPYRKSHL